MDINKLKWHIVDKKYVEYLKKFEDKIENINYNKKIKPYIGILIQINNFNYYVPISSAKNKHYKMTEGLDFIKIVQNEKILSVLNLNNMIPISNNNIIELKYKDIEKYREFASNEEKKKYISLLSLELSLINKKNYKIRKNASEIYNEKVNNPKSNISKRCCNFKLLEGKCIEYNKKIQYK